MHALVTKIAIPNKIRKLIHSSSLIARAVHIAATSAFQSQPTRAIPGAMERRGGSAEPVTTRCTFVVCTAADDIPYLLPRGLHTVVAI